jgi:cytochrome c oxidase subunit 4
MQHGEADVRKSIRSYMIVFGSLMVLTIITVAASSLQVGVALGVAIALAIATIKASMVAGVFMHLAHEKMWIYGSLILTAVFFAVLIMLPLFTGLDHIGTPGGATTLHGPPAAAGGEHAGH